MLRRTARRFNSNYRILAHGLQFSGEYPRADGVCPCSWSDFGQAHLRVGLAALRTFREPAAASLSRVEAQASIRAFKNVLGDARVDTMLQGARHVAGVAGSARPPA